MTAPSETSVIVGLDIGTSKIAAIVGEISADGQLEIKGLGTHPAHGMKKGVVVNMQATVASIQRAVEEAELMSDIEIRSVCAGIAGSHVSSRNSQGEAPVPSGEVHEADKWLAINAATAISLPSEQQVLHVLPQEFIIDRQDGVKDPAGMSARHLVAKVHLVTCASNPLQNIEKCIRRCGLEVETIVLEPLASSEAVLTEDERELGVCLIDIGGGTSDIAVFKRGAVLYTAVVPIAGDQVTNDIAMTLRTPTPDAENLKIAYAYALPQLAKADEYVVVPSPGNQDDRKLPRQVLAEVVEPRYEELFGLIQQQLRQGDLIDQVASGVVLTGGAAKMEGIIELAKDVLDMPVSLGTPRNVAGIKDIVSNPIHATGVGLMLHGMKRRQQAGDPADAARPGWLDRFRRWFNDNL